MRIPLLLLSVLCALSLSAAVGCKSRIPEPEPTVNAPADPAPTKPVPESTPAAPVVEPAKPLAREGWSEVKLQNNLSVCMFADANQREKTQTMVDVKRQVLGAGRPIVFGVFAPNCIDPKCDEATTLQCSVERSGNILRLQTRYVGLHKDGTTCSGSSACRNITAGCESPSLEAGQYTLEYSGKEIPLKIPAALNMPCFAKQ